MSEYTRSPSLLIENLRARVAFIRDFGRREPSQGLSLQADDVEMMAAAARFLEDMSVCLAANNADYGALVEGLQERLAEARSQSRPLDGFSVQDGHRVAASIIDPLLEEFRRAVEGGQIYEIATAHGRILDAAAQIAEGVRRPVDA